LNPVPVPDSVRAGPVDNLKNARLFLRPLLRSTEHVDLYPTLADLAGVSAPDTLQGKSLKPLLADTESSAWAKDQAFTISRSGGESIRTNDWRFTQWGFGEKGMELYNLKNDPGEFTNQARNPDYTTVLKTLKKRLLAKRDDASFASNKAVIVEKVNLKKRIKR